MRSYLDTAISTTGQTHYRSKLQKWLLDIINIECLASISCTFKGYALNLITKIWCSSNIMLEDRAKYGLAIGDDPKTVDPGLIWPDFRGAKHNHIRLKPAKLTKTSFKYLLTQQKKQVIILQKLKRATTTIHQKITNILRFLMIRMVIRSILKH